MKVNMNDYILSKPFIQKTLLERPDNILTCISELAATTFVPIIVVCCYAGETLGWTEEIVDKTIRIKDFYGYTEIIGLEKDILGRIL